MTACGSKICFDEHINREVYKHFRLTYVFPSIKEKRPVGEMKRPIFVQQDNATPHVVVSDPDIVAAGTEYGWNISLVCQPANSPDFNVLGLGYFAAIQRLQYEQNVFTTEMLIKAGAQSFKDLDSNKLNSIFLTLQQVMECVLICKGGNDYKLPHMAKVKNKVGVAKGCESKEKGCEYSNSLNKISQNHKIYKRNIPIVIEPNIELPLSNFKKQTMSTLSRSSSSSSLSSLSYSSDMIEDGKSLIYAQRFFDSTEYTDRKSIRLSVINFHHDIHRSFRTTRSDDRRLKAVCEFSDCLFEVYFSYGKKYGPPTRIIPHTCTLSDANGKTSRVVKPLWTARQLVQHVDNRNLFHQHKRAVTPTMIMNVVSSQGNQTSLMNCANACKKLIREFFGDDIRQYRLLTDYVSISRQNDHDVILEMEDKQFTRMQIVFREGKQVFKSYAQSGLCLDGTFLKNVNGERGKLWAGERCAVRRAT
uniref:Transposase putative n=1 Tax=Albugo laibachii Nc14 TaxID=890382 RepID=F0WVQ5_9STRA|nr:transposase putative [Albugo laibachii Nc14]|eukprot:CCA25501.1 transposase putative [Albugo laibachii Nc14]